MSNISLKKIITKLGNLLKRRKMKKLKSIKEQNLRLFSKKYINESEKIYNKETKYQLNDDFDFFISGSDQVWNPNFLYGDDVYFLQFTEYTKRISYAPSFGISKIEKEYDVYKKLLNDFNYISVREEDGKKIVKEMTGRDVPVLVDPTLLLTKEDWYKIFPSKRKPIEKKYILVYFLGEAEKDGLKETYKIAKKNNLEVINLLNLKYEKFYTVDPAEFVSLFANASLIMTDSFHGTIFSIIFEKPFIAYKREQMNSRIDSLLKMFNLNERKIENIAKENYFEINYDRKSIILKQEREKSFNYLKTAIEEVIKNES
jgi:hypothetical protein